MALYIAFRTKVFAASCKAKMSDISSSSIFISLTLLHSQSHLCSRIRTASSPFNSMNLC